MNAEFEFSHCLYTIVGGISMVIEFYGYSKCPWGINLN